MYNSLGGNALDAVKTTTLQGNLDQLIPGLAALLLTLLCCKLLKKNVSPIVIIIALFIVGIGAHVIRYNVIKYFQIYYKGKAQLSELFL